MYCFVTLFRYVFFKVCGSLRLILLPEHVPNRQNPCFRFLFISALEQMKKKSSRVCRWSLGGLNMWPVSRQAVRAGNSGHGRQELGGDDPVQSISGNLCHTGIRCPGSDQSVRRVASRTDTSQQPAGVDTHEPPTPREGGGQAASLARIEEACICSPKLRWFSASYAICLQYIHIVF